MNAKVAATRKARPYFVKSAKPVGGSVELIEDVWTQSFETKEAKGRQILRLIKQGRLILDHGHRD